jgi:hypothetical protein
MIIDIIADSERGAYEYHSRIAAPTIEYSSEQKKLSIHHPMFDSPMIFIGVNLHQIKDEAVFLKGLTAVASGTGEAPKSRIIRISAL